RRGDFPASVEHLPARARHAVDAPQRPARDAGALRGPLRGDVPHGVGVSAGRETHPGHPGAPRARAAPGQDEESRAVRGETGLRLPRLSPTQASERTDLGAEPQEAVFPAPVALSALDAT